jgi:CRP-like cAMP-binding protein
MTPQELLRLHPFFSGLSAGDIEKLSARASCKRIPAGKLLFPKNAPGDGLYGVLSGRIAFTMNSPEGKTLTLNTLGSGEFFGEIALLDGKGRSAAAVAREASVLLYIPRDEFLAFVRERPDTMLHIISVVCGRLRRSTEYIADAAFLDLPRRLAKQLILLLDGAGKSQGAELRISHAELASMLGVSRERVSRQLSDWQAKRTLDQGRGRIMVRSVSALERLARGLE